MRPPAPEAGADKAEDRGHKGLIGHPRQVYDSDGLELPPRSRRVLGAPRRARSSWPRWARDERQEAGR
jgi:hypothetical protein